MLEQQDHISPNQPPTELEGIRQKVYIDRYSLKDASGQPLEHHPEDTWARVARGIAAVETTEEKRAYWEKRFYEALSDFQFVPGGRILAGAGSGHQVTFYNCFSGETLVHTQEGLLPINTLQGEHAVLSDGGVYRTAFFKSYGKQQLWQVTLANGTTIHATPDHEWVVSRESGGTQRVLTRELAGRRIPVNPRPAPAYNGEFSEGVQHGIVYGDGSIQYGKAHVCLFGEKEHLARWFDTYGYKESGGTVATKEHVRIQALPAEWKALPAATASPSYWRGFVAGLIATDGHVDNRGSVAIYNHDREALQQIAEGMALAGFVSSSITMTRETSPYDGEEKPVYRLQIFNASVNQRDILHPQHLEHFLASPQAKHASIEVVSVEETERYEEVFCCVEPETHTITISHGYLTGQCYVIPSPEDSRNGILDNLKLMTEIMARGGGVGINLSTLRPRGSYIKTVNGTASGPCSWAQLYSVATGDVIQQGGCFGPDEHVATDKGLISTRELADRLDKGEVIQAQTHKGRRPFTAVFRNGTRDLYEVTTLHGYHVRVTLDHKMAVLHDGKITTIPLKQLKENDEVLLLFGEGSKAEVHPDPIRSITFIGPSHVFDFEVEEVHLLSVGSIYSSNSRRGALMLMLDDNHPDVEEFITVKRTAGKIEHANLSVCISDKFMQAVKDDTDWDLIWNGEVKKTIRARSLWDLICTSAWESAEPGMVFMDRYNTESNTWYYEDIRCVNPCVTGDTLVSTEHGYTPARDLQIGMKVRTPAGLKPIEKLYNNGMKRIYRVDFSDGGYLKGTADHKLKVVRDKKYQWVPIAELVEGDKVLVMSNETFGPRQSLPVKAVEYIANRDLQVASHYDRNLGLIVGAVLGDGTLRELPNGNSHSYQCKVAFGVHEDGWYDTFTNLMTDMNIHTHRTLAEKEFAVGGVLVKHASVRLECYKLASLLVRIGMTPNIKSPQKTIPIAFLSMEKDFLAGILDGLFSTDGSVLMKQDNPMLRFHTSSYELAQQVRLILLQFGIHGRIYRATRDEDLMYDGRSMYGTGEKYDVIIMNEGIARFYAEIGLSHPEKAARLKDIAENWHYLGGTWTASVVSVTDTESEEEVYDLFEPDTLTWITNGYCSLDCGEQGLPAFGVCNLGAINLSAFVHNGQMDYKRLAEMSKVAMRFLDNVVDANEYFIEENRVAQMGTRRTGLGTMGLADALIKMQIAYGSEESLPIIERIYSTIRDASYDASADNAAEKGAFASFDRDKYMQGRFIKRLPKAVQDKIKKQGIRNAVLLTQAPTGTTSLLAGVSSGIEPVYDFAMIRRDRTGEHIMYHPLLQEWRDEHPNDTTPHYFVSSKDLTPEEHVRVQAMVQRYTDSSISKTVNAPNEHTVEEVQKLYRLAYEMGCKGITYYRDGSRDAVLTRVEDEKKAAELKQAQQAPMIEPVMSIQQGVKPRPAVVQGYTRQVNAPEGKINVTINSDDHGPLEVFVNVGKAGSDIAALAEALGRLISLNLRILSPLTQTDRAQEIADQLRGIGGSRSVGFGPQQVRSLPDAVARALELHMETLQSTQEEHHSEEPHNGKHTDVPDAFSLSKLTVTGNLCPQCGCNTMVNEEGCRKCYSCGHSEC